MNKVEVVYFVWDQCAPNVLHSIMSRNERYSSIKLSDDTTRLLDLLLAMTDCDKFRELLQNLVDINATVPLDSPLWPGCTALHLAVYMTENTKLWNEFFIKSDSQERLDLLFQNYKNTEEDKTEYRNRIEICLEYGCSVTIKNADGLTPIHLAFKLHKTEIINLLLNKCEINCDDSSDLSFLHIACAVENLDVVKRLLDKGADINRQTKVNFYCQDQSNRGFNHIPVNSTTLHIATILENETMVTFLINMEADIYAENALGMTPIHFSLFSNKSIAQFYLKKALVLRESVSKCGLSYLHIAAFADDTNAIEKLLQMGADIDRVFEDTKRGYCITPLQVAIKCRCMNAITTLMRNGTDIFKQCADEGTSLQNLLRYLDHPDVHDCIENKLKLDQCFHEVIDDNGMTLLHVACYMFDLEWAEKLLKEGANVNAEIQGDSINFDENWTGCTPMHMLIYGISRDVDDDGDKPKMNNFVKLLIENGADLFATDYCDRSPLLLAHYKARENPSEGFYDISYEFETTLIPTADLLLRSQSSYKVNPSNDDYFSHFHYACMRNEVDVVKTYLENGIDTNHAADVEFEDQCATNFTPLHFALFYRSLEVACLLIERGADVNAKNGDGDTPLHIAILRDLVDSDLFEMLLSHGADINAHSSIHSTPICCYFDNCEITHKQLKLFRAYGALAYLNDESADGLIRLDMNRAKPCDREAIFEELIDFCDVKNALKNKLNPIENMVSVIHDDKIALSFYLNAIQRFINMGCKLDRKNKNGETALYIAKYNFENLVAMEALLLLGADVNLIKNDRPLYHEERNTVSSLRIKKLFSVHVWKMKLVGLIVPKRFETTMLKIHEEYPLDKDLPQLCEDELARLSEMNIGESVTIKDFLSECGLVKDYPTMSSIQRENVDKFFLKFDEVRQNFPQFVGLLMMQYRKAVEAFDRFKMYEIVMGLLPSVIQVKLSRKLPYLCLKNILKYFSNDELDFFIKGQYSDGKTSLQSPGADERKRKYVQVTN